MTVSELARSVGLDSHRGHLPPWSRPGSSGAFLLRYVELCAGLLLRFPVTPDVEEPAAP